MKYSDIANQYANMSKNQLVAGDKLIQRLQLKGHESILDLGCGPGHITARLKKDTSGRVVGVDASSGMIEQAQTTYGDAIEFVHISAESINFDSEFDVVFCNSVFHWFKEPKRVLSTVHKALKPNGVFALQTPVKIWSSFIKKAIDTATQSPKIKQYTDHFINPWFHLNNANEYKSLLEQNGFNVSFTHDEETVTPNFTLQQIIGQFNSGPALAYLNQSCYSIHIDQGYKTNFIATLSKNLKTQMNGFDTVDLSYNRAFLLAKKI